MKNGALVLVLLFFTLGCNKSKELKTEIAETSHVTNVNDVELEVYDFNGLKPFLNKQDDKIYVINFWATWCAPCIKELPYFETLNSKYKKEKVEVVLVSLDFPNQYEKRLKPFIKKNKLQSKVIALDDTDQNTWIPAIDENWTGAIPATLIYNNTKRKFYEKSFTYKELETELKQFLKL